MPQQITVTSNASVNLKPLLEAAIRSELRLLEVGLERTRARLHAFEERHDMASEEFARRFNAGELGESVEFIEWAGEIKTYEQLEAQRQALQDATIK